MDSLVNMKDRIPHCEAHLLNHVYCEHIFTRVSFGPFLSDGNPQWSRFINFWDAKFSTVVSVRISGAQEAYIGKWDLSDLSQKSIWPIAAGQIYFSNSLGTGVMTAFGSFTKEESNIVAVWTNIIDRQSLNLCISFSKNSFAVIGDLPMHRQWIHAIAHDEDVLCRLILYSIPV